MATDPREPYGRIFHEQGRLTVNAERAKPFHVEPWDERTAEQQEIDMRGASAVAARAVADAGIDLAAKEMRILQLEAALRRHTHSFTDRHDTEVCGGCLEPAPCPDAALVREGP